MARDEPTADATIGEVFPPEDEVAQFVFVLCAQRNDLFEAIRQVVTAVDEDRNAMHYYHRLVISHYFEAVKWLTHAVKRSSAVVAWLEVQPEEIRRARDTLLATGTRNGLARKALWAGRKATFHYPQLSEEKDGLRSGLEAIAEIPADIKREPDEVAGRGAFHPHFEFAEDLMTFRMFETFGEDQFARVAEIQAVAIQYIHFVDDCFQHYMAERGLTLGGGPEGDSGDSDENHLDAE